MVQLAAEVLCWGEESGPPDVAIQQEQWSAGLLPETGSPPPADLHQGNGRSNLDCRWRTDGKSVRITDHSQQSAAVGRCTPAGSGPKAWGRAPGFPGERRQQGTEQASTVVALGNQAPINAWRWPTKARQQQANVLSAAAQHQQAMGQTPKTPVLSRARTTTIIPNRQRQVAPGPLQRCHRLGPWSPPP